MKIFTDKRLLRAGLIGGTLTRHSGNMRQIPARQAAYQELGISLARMLHFHQVHSDTVIPISCLQDAQTLAQKPLQDADGWLLSPFPAGWGAAIVTADCVPLFLWDEHGTCAALAHCGWRGIVQGLPGKVAQQLRQKNQAATLNAFLGPHIQACCFEVQADVAAQFPADCVQHKGGKLFVNLTVAIIRQLTQAGVPEKDIHAPHYCTCGDSENFFSWRRDHEKNLLLSFVYKP